VIIFTQTKDTLILCLCNFQDTLSRGSLIKIIKDIAPTLLHANFATLETEP
jgi:hypothetical protein